jgi:hypothetical protein
MPLAGAGIVSPHLQSHVVGWRNRGLPDTCTVTRASTTVTAVDPETLQRVPSLPSLVYSGPCSAQPAPYGDRIIVLGDEQVVVRKYVVSVEAAAVGIDVDDVVTVTATDDPELQGRPLVVIDITADTFASRRLLVCEDRPGVQP